MSSTADPTPPAPKPAAPTEEATRAPMADGPDTAPYIPAAGARPIAQLPTMFGRYRLTKLLGQGGMGAVYLAHDTQLDRPVALKVPHFSADDGPQVLARFYREARAAATVLHPNICPVYDVGEIDGAPYLTMAFIEGKSLAAFIRVRPLTPRQCAMLVRKLALALAEAHKHGVIHRDLKPANIMIDKRGEPMVMDFGLARRVRAGDVRLTHKGDVLGTPAYMPPEQVSGDVAAMGPACDVYSLGVILYELLTGRLPFAGDPMAMLSQVLLDEPPPPTKFKPDLDGELSAICLKAMAKKSQQRYGSMTELAVALQNYLRNRPPAPAREEREDATVRERERPANVIRIQRGKRRREGSRWLWIAGGVATAAAALLASLLFLLPGHTPHTENTTVMIAQTPPHPEVVPRNPLPPKAADNPLVQKIVPADGFALLFNGKDFAGWDIGNVHPGVWRVENGEMAFRVIDPPRQRGWLLTERDYTDFLLRFEFRLFSGANSGVALRTWPGAAKQLEIQIQDDSYREFKNQGPTDRTGALYGVAVDRPAELKPLGVWNRMEIELRGWSLRVAVNGQETLRTRLNSEAVFRYLEGAPNGSGRIGFQHWLGSAHFRKVEVKELR